MIMSVRRRAREIALQVLYQLDIDPQDPRKVIALHWENFQPSEQAREFCLRLVEGVLQNQGEIDRLVEENSENWTLKRMAVVDRNILRLATFELRYCPDIPFKVTLNEAVELAKKFSADDSGAFINGILDKIYSLLDKTLKDQPDIPWAKT
jgi:transcription antitermination protein NusB